MRNSAGVLSFLALLFTAAPAGAWREFLRDDRAQDSRSSATRFTTGAALDSVPRGESAASLRKHKEFVALQAQQGAVNAPAPVREPTLLSDLEPGARESAALWSKNELSTLAQAMYTKTNIALAVSKLGEGRDEAVKVLTDLSRLAVDPTRNYDDIFRTEPLLNTLLHTEGIHVRLYVDFSNPRVPLGQLAMTVHTFAAVHKAEVKGMTINTYETRRVDSVDYKEGLLGSFDGGPTFAVINANEVDRAEKIFSALVSGAAPYAFRVDQAGAPFVAGFPSNQAAVATAADAEIKNDLTAFKPGELRAAVIAWVTNHEASHVYFGQAGGGELVTKASSAGQVSEVNEARAYLSELAHGDARIVKADLADIFRIALSPAGAVNKTGSKSALVLLDERLPSVSFFRLTSFDFPVMDVDVKNLPALFRLSGDEIKRAAAEALKELDRKYGLP